MKIIQIILFIIGCIVLGTIGNSGGYHAESNIWSYIGGGICILGIGLPYFLRLLGLVK